MTSLIGGSHLKTLLAIVAVLILIALVLPFLHLLAFALVVVAAAIVVMAAWKVLFGGAAATSAGHDRSGPPAING